MDAPDKLPLVKQSVGLLLQSLKPTDTVAIVVYAGAAGAVLEPTQVKDSNKILAALEQLQAGGATDGAQGLALAYQLAERNFRKEAINRVILATDGDFNVGVTQDESLEDFVARKRKTGIYLSVFGFGEGNYQDALMQSLAQNGNGIAAYIDTLGEAQKILVDEATRALFPIANDVKIQVEFNPGVVAEYRLIGYETRALEREDFNNDSVDAGDIGAGHTVTAIYEITPVNSKARLMDDSRYQKAAQDKADSQEVGFLKLRYKLPGETQSHLVSTPIVQSSSTQEATDSEKALQAEINFSVAVAGFGQILRGGKHTGDWNYDDVIEMAQSNKGDDEYGYRTEFVQLARKAKTAQGM
jgi:Ca-activated chloride channel family protein